jgi:hypothetical protein
MIDIASLPRNAEQTLSVADFEAHEEKSGRSIPPQSVTIRRGAGVNGSDRVTLVWPDYNPATMQIADAPVAVNAWLWVTVKANQHTGLAGPDVFVFGNLIGESGDSRNVLRVSALDLAAMRRGLNSTATLLNTLDVNRDGRVNALDLTAARTNLGRRLDTPPLP